MGTTQVCHIATDGCGNTKEVCFNVVVNSTSTGGNGDCNAITITPSGSSITVGGLVAPVTYLQVFDGAFNQVYNCAGNCASPTVVVGNLVAGTYFVKASLADATWVPTCSKELFVNVTGGGTTTILTFNAPANITVSAAAGATSAVVNYTAPTATTTCTTGSITYQRTSGLTSGASFPVGTTNVCYSATDGCGNTKSVCFNVVVQATTAGGGPDCNAITFTTTASTLTVGNLVAPVVMIQLFDGSYAPAGSCVGNCNTPTHTFSGLAAGTYYVKVDLLNAQWQGVCQRNETITITSALAVQSQLAFTASKLGKSTDLRWLSNTGDVNDYFEVERSANGLDFETILDVNGRGVKGEMMYFSQVDNAPLSGDNYYRLRLVGRDGSVKYSDTQKINFASLSDLTLFPNPTSDVFFVNLLPAFGKAVDLSLYNAQGQVMAQKSVIANDQAVEWNTTDLQSGVYMVKIDIAGQRSVMLKVVIQR